MSFDPETAKKLEMVLSYCIKDPSILHEPEFSVVKNFIEHFGGKIPDLKPSETTKEKIETKPDEAAPEPEPESEESDLELDMTGVIEPDADEPHEMGDPSLEPTEEQIDEALTKQQEAVSAFLEKDYEKAIQLYTEIIKLNPKAALSFAKRGQVFLHMGKPNACIRDCTHAIELNPDSAAAHKFRGRAYQLLGKWEEAAHDLRLACKFDFDEQAGEWLNEVTPNARKIEAHKRKKERKMQEKSEHEKTEGVFKRCFEKAAEATDRKTFYDSTKAGQQNTKDFFRFMFDPDVRDASEDLELRRIFSEISANPSAILKYQNNPKVMAFISKIAPKFASWGVVPEEFAAAAENTETGTNPPKPEPHDDVGLD